jgi:hypothetical protein
VKPGGYISLSSAIQIAFLQDLFTRVRCRRRVKPIPPSFPIRRSSPTDVNGRAIHDRSYPASISIVGLDADNRSASSETFRIHFRIVGGNAGLSKSTDDSTCCAARGCASERSHQPTSGYDRPDPRDRHKAKTRERANCATDCGSHAGAGSCRFGPIVSAV